MIILSKYYSKFLMFEICELPGNNYHISKSCSILKLTMKELLLKTYSISCYYIVLYRWNRAQLINIIPIFESKTYDIDVTTDFLYILR